MLLLISGASDHRSPSHALSLLKSSPRQAGTGKQIFGAQEQVITHERPEPYHSLLD